MSEKLMELILYIAQQSQDDPRFSSTKLNKILFIADFFAYGLWGESITGTTYVRRQFGPTPREMLQIQNRLELEGRAEIEERMYFGYQQKRLRPKANPDLSLFTPDQIALVDDVLNQCRELSATQLSDWTHRLPPWLSAEDGEEISYESVFVLERLKPGREDMKWAESALQEFEELEELGET